MDKLVKDLMELAKDGESKVLICWNKKSELSIHSIYDRKLIPDNDILGEIDLEIYNTYDEIFDEINYLLD